MSKNTNRDQQKSFGETVIEHLKNLREEKDDDKEKDDDDDDKGKKGKNPFPPKKDSKKNDDDKKGSSDSDDDKDKDADDDDDGKKKKQVDESEDFDKKAEDEDFKSSEENTSKKDVDKAKKATGKASRGAASGSTAKDASKQDKADKIVQEDDSDWLERFNELCNEQVNLSSDFREEAGKIFKQALAKRVKELVHEETMIAEDAFDEQVKSISEEIEHSTVKSIGDFLDYAIEEWVDSNKMSIEKNLRTHVMENFMDSLHTLFTEHYIDVPDTKVDILKEFKEEQKDANTEYKKMFNEHVALKEDFKKLMKKSARMEKTLIMNEECEDLTVTQAERLKSLVSESAGMTPEDFRKRIRKAKSVLVSESAGSRRLKRSNDNSSILSSDHDDITLSEDQRDKDADSGTKDPAMSKYVQHLTGMAKYVKKPETVTEG